MSIKRMLIFCGIALGLGVGVGSAADITVPFVGTVNELGYAEYIEDTTSPKAYLDFYRLRFNGTAQLDGVDYNVMHKYSYFKGMAFFDGRNIQSIKDYMRQEDGKVYVRYNRLADENCYFYNDEYKNEISPEYLLYDFNMEAGDELTLPVNQLRGDEPIVLKCIETGTLDTESGARKYLKFDTDVNPTTKEWMAFDMIVEGVGPVGNCEAVHPYRKVSNPDCATVDLLYLRGKYKTKENYEYIQGDMLYLTPLFEVKGIYDPSVWLWPDEDYARYFCSVPTVTNPESEITLSEEDGTLKLGSGSETISEVRIFDLGGRLLAIYRPVSTETRIATDGLNAKTVVIRVTTASGSVSFKRMLK